MGEARSLLGPACATLPEMASRTGVFLLAVIFLHEEIGNLRERRTATGEPEAMGYSGSRRARGAAARCRKSEGVRSGGDGRRRRKRRRKR